MVERLTQLCLMQDAGSYAEIAAVLSQEFTGEPFSKNSCIGQVHRLRITNGHPPGFKRGESKPKQPKSKPVKADERPGRKRKTLERAAPTPLPVQKHKSGTVPLIELRHGDCHWPYGNRPFLFCGDPARDASQYCPMHHALAYTKPQR